MSLELAVEAAAADQAGQDVVVDQVGEPVLVAATLGDVDDVDQHHVDVVVVVAQHPAAQGDVDVLALGVAQDAVGGVGLPPVVEDACQVVLDGVVVGRGELGQPPVAQLLHVETDDGAQGVVGELDPALVVEHGDPVRSIEEEALTALGGCARHLGLALEPLTMRCSTGAMTTAMATVTTARRQSSTA